MKKWTWILIILILIVIGLIIYFLFTDLGMEVLSKLSGDSGSNGKNSLSESLKGIFRGKDEIPQPPTLPD